MTGKRGAQRIELARQAAALLTRDEQGVVLGSEPADNRPAGNAVMGDESGAGRVGQGENVDPADMIGDQEHVAVDRATLNSDAGADRTGCHPQEAARPGGWTAKQAP